MTQSAFPPNARRPFLPDADSWDRQTGVNAVAEFEVDCSWTPINEDWALVRAMITLYDGVYTLSKDVEVKRVYRHVSGQRVESPELSALAWTKTALGGGGVPVLSMYERNPGHMQEPGVDGPRRFRWIAEVGSRLSVAVVRLDGNLSGMARLTLVE